MNKDELQEARTNPDFLKFLEENRLKAIENDDLALMYETLDSMLILDLEDDKINNLYQNILKTAFEKIEKIVNEDKKLNLKDENLLLVRALYEHGIEKWSYDNFDGAKEIMFVLSNIVDDELLEQSLNVLVIVLSNKMNLDEFYEKKVDLDVNDIKEEHGYFIVNFKFDIEEYLVSNEATLKKEFENLKHLLEA